MPGGLVIERVEPLGDNSPVNSILGSTWGWALPRGATRWTSALKAEASSRQEVSSIGHARPAAHVWRALLLTPARDLSELLEPSASPSLSQGPGSYSPTGTGR
jgi:hypothetical protein